MTKFRPYIYGTPFTVIADQCPLTGLKFAKDASSGKLHRWAVKLSEFDFTFVYRKGKKHSDADGLSRLTYADIEQVPESTEEIFLSRARTFTRSKRIIRSARNR